MAHQKPEPDLTLEGLVHDLNNALQTILDTAELISEDVKWKRAAGVIRRSAERGQRLVHDFCQATVATVDCSLIAEGAVQFALDFLDASKGPKIEFRTEIAPGLRLSGDPVAWERVLVNLLLNSSQAMRSGGTVDLIATQEEKGAQIRVLDNGPGIPKEILGRIFEARFSTKPKNSGLGLHIARSLVKQNGGAIRAENRPEGGAAFIISLP